MSHFVQDRVREFSRVDERNALICGNHEVLLRRYEAVLTFDEQPISPQASLRPTNRFLHLKKMIWNLIRKWRPPTDISFHGAHFSLSGFGESTLIYTQAQKPSGRANRKSFFDWILRTFRCCYGHLCGLGTGILSLGF